MERYDHRNIELKWQELWQREQTFVAPASVKGERARLAETSTSLASRRAKRAYVLDMFPYPSAQGLHVGHPLAYIATDIYSRYLRMKGVSVLHPMGWDAFGLPAENYAIKSGIHPRQTTMKSIDNFRRQLQALGFSYDWSREVSTADPAYYKWTQWLFLKLYEKGLAYRKEAPVNWCPSCQTVLANEQVTEGACERCSSAVEQRNMKQWFFKTTAYAERLLAELEVLDWPKPIVDMQKNWIGKSEGASVKFHLTHVPVRQSSGHPEPSRGVPGQKDGKHVVEVFTTRLDTIFGATFVVVSPELAKKWIGVGWQVTPEVKKYVEKSLHGRELERLERAAKEKTGVDTGVKAINPATNEEIPVWVADYVLGSYGTGAIMAVPAHDEKDFAFAKQFELKLATVVLPSFVGSGTKAWMSENNITDENNILAVIKESVESLKCTYAHRGSLLNSNEFDGMTSDEAVPAIAKKVGAELKTQYRLRDWLISRQRYWGAPIPIIYCEKCGEMPVLEKDLPVELPDDVDFRPTGESPLTRSKSFHDVTCPKCGKPAHRESDTMDTFVDSSWYWLRYCDPHNEKVAFDAKKVKQWCPVNLYVGGAEHAVLHLMYARFITKALQDMGYVDFAEPFLKLRNQGLILGEDGQKMSKSKGNVVNPDEIVTKFGADTLRMYEMFMGPLEEAKPWNTASIAGIRRFLDRVWNLCLEPASVPAPSESPEPGFLIAKTTKKVTDDIEAFGFNTAIAAMMEYVNYLASTKLAPDIRIKALGVLLRLLYPFAPHLTSELWQRLERDGYVWQQPWPEYDSAALKRASTTIAVQVNGKLRATIEVASEADEAAVIAAARTMPLVAKHLVSEPTKVVYVSGKLVNFVV